MGKSKNSGKLGGMLGLLIIVACIALAADIFTIPIKYYFLNHANDYVAEIVRNEDAINNSSEVTIEMLNTKLEEYYDDGLMESRPKLFINGKEVDLLGYDRAEKLEFPPGEYEITLTGYHSTYLIPLKLGKMSDISSTRTIKK